MSSLVFAWDNLLFETGVAFATNASFNETPGYPMANLANPHPAPFMRVDTPGNSNLEVTFPGARTVSAIALISSTASPHVNFFSNSDDLTHVDWNVTNLTQSQATLASFNAGLSGPATAQSCFATGGGSVEHSISQSHANPGTKGSENQIMHGYARRLAGTANVQFRFTKGGDVAKADFDLGAGTVAASSATGTLGIVSTDITADGSGYFCELVASGIGRTTSTEGKAIVTDAAYATSYIQSGEATQLAGLQWERLATANAFIPSRIGQASFWYTSISGIGNNGLVWPAKPDHQGWYDTHGWIHSAVVGVATAKTSFIVFFDDPGNTEGQIDISNLFAGTVWQVAQNLPLGGATWLTPDPETGGRRLRTSFTQQTEAEIFGQLQPMLNRVRVGRPRETRITNSGQEYRPGHLPVLVIINPDEDTFGQETMLYGFIDTAVYSMMDSHPGLYDMSLTFTEVLP